MQDIVLWYPDYVFTLLQVLIIFLSEGVDCCTLFTFIGFIHANANLCYITLGICGSYLCHNYCGIVGMHGRVIYVCEALVVVILIGWTICLLFCRN